MYINIFKQKKLKKNKEFDIYIAREKGSSQADQAIENRFFP